MSRRTILIVEDNDDNRIIYATLLEHSGYRVLLAVDGAEGIRIAGQEKPDLVLMDIAVPVLDGWRATERLKEDPVTAGIPVIALTAHAMDADREKAREVGCDGYLAKPIEPRRVLEEVGRLIGPAAATAND